jgi:hypothetical protein
MHRLLFLPTALAAIFLSAAAASADDYPTDVRADYVFACMAAQDGSREALRRCSCSIDAIADSLPLDDYIRAETVLRMRQIRGGGEKFSMFYAPWADEAVAKLGRAQVAAELRCFPEIYSAPIEEDKK